MKTIKLFFLLSSVSLATVCQAEPSQSVNGKKLILAQGVTANQAAAVRLANPAGKVFAFPGVAEDLGAGEYWYRRKPIHGGGNQKHGYDLTTLRFDKQRNAWTRLKPGVNINTYNANKTNQAWMVYNKPIYAVSDGEVVSCWRNAPENPAPGKSHPGRLSNPKTIYGGGNFLNVDIGGGERILYAHFPPKAIPSDLCPINKVFTADASDKSDQTLPAANRPKIKRGQFLGRVGNSGSSSNPHLHIHRSKGSTPLTLRFDSFMFKSSDDPGDVNAPWQKRNNSTLPPGKIAVLPKYTKGLKEIARHGVPSSKYQGVFDHISRSGYQLEWIDGFSVGNKAFFNVVFRPASGKSWVSFHNLSGAQYQKKFNQQKAKGRGLHQVESYRVGNKIRYAAIFRKGVGATKAYHGLSAAQHQTRFEKNMATGWRAKNVSVTSVNGKRKYAALYTKSGKGKLRVKSFLTSAQYQQEFNSNKAAGRQLSYLNTYVHKGKPRFTAIWSSAVKGPFRAKHGLSSSSYQSNWQNAVGDGFLTRNVTGYTAGGKARYAAVWRK